jgi:iron complex outermembrane receptor protein
MNLSSGFRAPHSSELLTNGAHHGSFRYEIGNLDLKTENALQLDLSSNFHLEHFDIIINPFVNRINNYIYINPQNYAIDGLQVYTYEQVDYAFLIGGDIGVHWHPHKAHWLHLESSYSIIDGRDKDGNALPLIPPARINNLIKFDLNLPGKFQVEGIVVQHQYIFEQDRVTDFETKTPGYHLLNLSANMKLSQKIPLYISLGARNILNVAYFNHLGSLKQIGIPNPGRNFFIKLNYKFEKQIKK